MIFLIEFGEIEKNSICYEITSIIVTQLFVIFSKTIDMEYDSLHSFSAMGYFRLQGHDE